VVGAGPAGLEAARVLGERGHDVVLLEAADVPGGQVRLASRAPARRDLIGIIDWRVSECERLGVKIIYNAYADEPAILAHRPEVVIVATGGVPDSGFAEALDGWDVLAGAASPTGDVLLYDDNGGHAGLDVARALIAAGADLQYVTPERMFAPDLGGMNYPQYAKEFAASGTPITLLHSLHSVRRLPGGRVAAVLYSDHADRYVERIVDHVVVEQGTRANDELYHELAPRSINLGEVDQRALLDLRPQTVRANDRGTYELYRIGDAVNSRNVHAAVYDAFRLCLAI
jgi:plasmid stabilization system protein ParE